MRSNSLSLLRSTARLLRARPIARCRAQYGVRWKSDVQPEASEKPQWSTPLAKKLADAITATGPVSVASYMRQCLTSPGEGYYTRETSGHDQFGAKGDFVTSPEISQVFGELVGIWLYTEWLAQGKKDKVQIIEVGPGRGTLMDDVLRTISNFKPFAKSIESIYLIEASPYLQEQQAKRLASTGRLDQTHGTEDPVHFTSASKHIPGAEIKWCEDMYRLPHKETPTPFIIAHEFFDALPIHVFQNIEASKIPASSTIITPTGPIKPKHGPQAPKNQWHELVVAPNPPPDSEFEAGASSSPFSKQKEREEFHLTVSKSPTPHSLFLPQQSPRYKALEKTPDAIIEISPESLTYARDFALRIGGPNTPDSNTKPSTNLTPSPTHDTPSPLESRKEEASGCALILDYGPLSTIPTNTLRGIRSHQPCSPFTSPGLVDLTADVDFLALAETAINSSPGVEVHGPVEQAFFLGTMGIQQRAEKLMNSALAKGEKGVDGKELSAQEIKKRVEQGWRRLVDVGPQGMGRIYKAMAIVPYQPGKVRRPVGFGGDVVG